MNGRKKRGRILFSSNKQLKRARMGRKKAKALDADISETARVLSYNVVERDCDHDRHRSLEKDGKSAVRLLEDEYDVMIAF